MLIQGHVENGVVIPDAPISLPDGTEVTIVVRAAETASAEVVSPDERARRLAALAALDAVANENPGDRFSGADHDQALYDRP